MGIGLRGTRITFVVCKSVVGVCGVLVMLSYAWGKF